MKIKILLSLGVLLFMSNCTHHYTINRTGDPDIFSDISSIEKINDAEMEYTNNTVIITQDVLINRDTTSFYNPAMETYQRVSTRQIKSINIVDKKSFWDFLEIFGQQSTGKKVREKARNAEIFFTDGSQRTVDNCKVLPDSTFWFNESTGVQEIVSTDEIIRIVISRPRKGKIIFGMLGGSISGALLFYAGMSTGPAGIFLAVPFMVAGFIEGFSYFSSWGMNAYKDSYLLVEMEDDTTSVK